jgi:hypothetical protein
VDDRQPTYPTNLKKEKKEKEKEVTDLLTLL